MTATTARRRPGAALAAVLSAALLAACDKPAPSGPTASAGPAANAAAASSAGHGASGIAWREAANDAEIDAAFAAARAEHKPVFVYWGAKWCPPCNQVKATLFNRQDFIERSRAFVAGLRRRRQPGCAEDRRALPRAAAIRPWCCSMPAARK